MMNVATLCLHQVGNALQPRQSHGDLGKNVLSVVTQILWYSYHTF